MTTADQLANEIEQNVADHKALKYHTSMEQQAIHARLQTVVDAVNEWVDDPGQRDAIIKDIEGIYEHTLTVDGYLQYYNTLIKTVINTAHKARRELTNIAADLESERLNGHIRASRTIARNIGIQLSEVVPPVDAELLLSYLEGNSIIPLEHIDRAGLDRELLKAIDAIREVIQYSLKTDYEEAG